MLPIVNASYTVANNEFVNVNIFAKDADLQAILQNYVTTTSAVKSKQEIKVGSDSVNWDVYKLEIAGRSTPPQAPQPTDGGGTTGASGSGTASAGTVTGADPIAPVDLNITTFYLVGTYYHNLYLIQLSGDMTKLQLGALITSKATDMADITEQITDSLTKPEARDLPLPTLTPTTKPKSEN